VTNATKIISTYYNGYSLARGTNLYITQSGGVGNLGVYVYNRGRRSPTMAA